MNKIKGIYSGLIMAIGLAIIIIFLYLTRGKNNALRARRSCKIWFPLCGFKLEKIGEFDTSATLIIMNHQSLTDIMCLEAYHPQNICWVAKKELGEIPFYGYALRGPEMILIDREDKKGLSFLLKSAEEKISQKRPLVIFPEGTRSKGDADFLPFKVGAKILAERLKLKIQPIVVIHTKKLFNTTPIESLTNHARMVLLPAFHIGDAGWEKNWYETLQEVMHTTYLQHYREMEKQGE